MSTFQPAPPACKQCGAILPAKRKLKDFCNYAHRGQFNALEATNHQTGLACAKNTKQNNALLSLKRQSVAGFSFARINSSTYRLDRPGRLGAGWLMEVAWAGGIRQRWIARVRNRASEPLPLDAAKRAAVAMLRERGNVEPRDWIKALNQIAADEVDRAALMQERRLWPLDLVGGSRRGSMQIDRETRAAILQTELAVETNSAAPPLQGEDYPLTYDENGYPELPACLDRWRRA
jgi:hypothetical protein